VSASIRVYFPFLPYPVIEGAYLVVFDQIRSLVRLGHRVELVTWLDPAASREEKLRRFRELPFADEVRMLTAGDTRHSRSGSGAPAAPTRWRSGETLATRTRRVVGSIFSRYASPEIFHYPVDADPAARLPEADLGIYHYSFAYPWLKRLPHRPERRVHVHFHNLESELARIRAPRSRGVALSPGGWLHRLNSRKLRAHEAELHGLADELWFVSPTDLDLYAETIGNRERLRLVPPTYDLESAAERKGAWLSRSTRKEELCLGFLGTLDFEPNRLSLQWIVEELAPLLAQRGFRGRIVVAGRGVPDALRAAGDRWGFFDWCGFLPDLEEFWVRLSFLLVPHVGGSGTRTKLLEALALGVPVLANGDAVSALRPDLRETPHLFVANSAAQWADRIVAEREPFRTRLEHAGHDLRGSSLDGEAVFRFLDGSRAEAEARR
jgi:glycosyltransferase involved in cell wall biosynthesis